MEVSRAEVQKVVGTKSISCTDQCARRKEEKMTNQFALDQSIEFIIQTKSLRMRTVYE